MAGKKLGTLAGRVRSAGGVRNAPGVEGELGQARQQREPEIHVLITVHKLQPVLGHAGGDVPR